MTASSKTETLAAVPVALLWDDILLLSVHGVLDSKQAQDAMESVLSKIQETSAGALILDILNVTAVDSAVANHLIKITQATRLMGCECIISGISPEVAQTLVHLGVSLGDVKTSATLKAAFSYALGLRNLEVRSKAAAGQ